MIPRYLTLVVHSMSGQVQLLDPHTEQEWGTILRAPGRDNWPLIRKERYFVLSAFKVRELRLSRFLTVLNPSCSQSKTSSYL